VLSALIGLVCIDEAHVVGQWANHFRKDYGELSALHSLLHYDGRLLVDIRYTTDTAPYHLYHTITP
jgi:superfamily II DNA helicase RecQ